MSEARPCAWYPVNFRSFPDRCGNSPVPKQYRAAPNTEHLGVLAAYPRGISKLASSSRSMARLWGAMLVGGSALILACNLGILHVRDDVIWPLLLIGFGLVVLMQTLETRKASEYVSEAPRQSVAESDNLLNASAIFGSVKRKIETQHFQGGSALSVFGNVDIDLRRVQLAPGEKSVSLEANALFGAVKLRVPETWRADTNGAAILGNRVVRHNGLLKQQLPGRRRAVNIQTTR
jgi:Cell wall-active antibiotics response 4TMS YvqF